MTTIKVKSVNISREKGTIKKPVSEIILNELGVYGDAHSGKWHRQVSLLGTESIQKFQYKNQREIQFGEFAENITTEGLLLYEMQPLDILKNKNITLEITQIGKECHGSNCAIYNEVGNCVMPNEGIFARVLKGGILKEGDILEYFPKIFKITIITLSDRASSGEYSDKSGPLIEKMLLLHFGRTSKHISINRIIIPDESSKLRLQLENAFATNADMVITTGGTGISHRDITPEVVKPLLDKEIPGIIDYIRLKYGAEKPQVLLSRAVAGVKNKTLIFTLPGSPRAVKEYMDEILKITDHAFLMIYGLGH